MREGGWRYWLKVCAVYTAVSIVANGTLYLWLKANTHAGFRFSEMMHNVQRRTNDFLHSGITSNDGLRASFHSLLDVAPADIFLRYALLQWGYKDDLMFWDVPTPPVLVGARMEGDCDDYARLSAYMLHYKGYRFVYYVALVSDDEGHAVAAFYDETRRVVGLADINGWTEIAADQFSLPFDVEKLVVKVYQDTRHLSIRTWDLKKLLYTLEVANEISG